jgi:predicted N-acetyltransferase YhbS
MDVHTRRLFCARTWPSGAPQAQNYKSGRKQVPRTGGRPPVDGWTLCEATEADAATVAALVQAAFEEYRGQLDPPSGAHEETAATVRDKMKAAQVVLACTGPTAVGCVFFHPEGDHLYLFRLAVQPAFRRRGLGQALIEHAEGRARALNLARVRLGVRAVLVGQRAYYERLGYRPVGAAAHPGYAETTYLLLEKELTGA